MLLFVHMSSGVWWIKLVSISLLVSLVLNIFYELCSDGVLETAISSQYSLETGFSMSRSHLVLETPLSWSWLSLDKSLDSTGSMKQQSTQIVAVLYILCLSRQFAITWFWWAMAMLISTIPFLCSCNTPSRFFYSVLTVISHVTR
jgi:hypothetical protein